MTAAVVVILVLLIMNLSGMVFGGAVPVADAPFETIAGAGLIMFFSWLFALPGMALGYPVLSLMVRQRLWFWWVCAVVGGLCGALYAAALDAILGFTRNTITLDIHAGFSLSPTSAENMILVSGFAFGMMTGLAARWMSTWDWFRSDPIPN